MTIQTRFNIGDKVWLVYESRAICGKIQSIFALPTGLYYSFDICNPVKENEVFASKEELMDYLSR